MNEPKIELSIKELKLRGVNPAKRARVRRVIEQELTRLIAEPDKPRSVAWRQTLAPHARTRITVAPGAKVDEVGAQIAREIVRDLEKRG